MTITTKRTVRAHCPACAGPVRLHLQRAVVRDGQGHSHLDVVSGSCDQGHGLTDTRARLLWGST